MCIYDRITTFYDGVKTQKAVIGRSLFGRNLYAVKIGEGRPIGIAQYAIHGREFITAALAVEHYALGLKKGSCWFVLLVNPDGALLSECGLHTAPTKKRETLLKLNNGNADFSLWKANGRGVDLNVNFDAKWGEGTKNVRCAGSENYIGESPFSEPESLALKTFTLKIRPDYTVSYHTKGEEIYWHFFQPPTTLLRDKSLAERLSKTTGYPIVEATGSVGGYKDWCIQTLGIPSFTVEVGAEEFTHPLRENALPNIVEHNRYALYELSGEIKR